jgi:hypothetical protein
VVRERLTYPEARAIVDREAEGSTSGFGHTAHELAVLKRDDWTCTAVVPDPRPWKQGELRRCRQTGSEVTVVDDRTYCPRHAPRDDGGGVRR